MITLFHVGNQLQKWLSKSLLPPLLFNPLILNQDTQWNLETQHPVCPRKCKSPRKDWFLAVWRGHCEWLSAEKRSNTVPSRQQNARGSLGPVQRVTQSHWGKETLQPKLSARLLHEVVGRKRNLFSWKWNLFFRFPFFFSFKLSKINVAKIKCLTGCLFWRLLQHIKVKN